MAMALTAQSLVSFILALAATMACGRLIMSPVLGVIKKGGGGVTPKTQIKSEFWGKGEGGGRLNHSLQCEHIVLVHVHLLG